MSWPAKLGYTINPVTGGLGNLLVAGAVAPVPVILAQSAVPVILVPNGTVAADGTITLGTALPTIYSGGAWVRLPAGAVVGGLAGLYFAVFSSSTVGAIKSLFADPATQFIPYLPTVALVAAVGSAVAYTQTTGAAITLMNMTVRGAQMGLTGSLRAEFAVAQSNNANGKTLTATFGGSNIFNAGMASTLSALGAIRVRNRGVYGSQVTTPLNTFGAPGVTAGNSPVYLTKDTSVDQGFTVNVQSAVATDYVVLEAFTAEVLPS